eukprot:PhM_4_TR3682/c0_g1_i1/m.104408
MRSLLFSRSRMCLCHATTKTTTTATASTNKQSQPNEEIPYMFQPDWSAEGPLQMNRPPEIPEDSTARTQLDWLDLAQYKLKGYWLTDAAAALDSARTCDGADATMARQLILDMVLFCKQRRGNLAMDACTRLLRRYPQFATDPVGLANLGTIFSINDDHARAIQVLEQVPRSHPVWIDQAASWLAEAYCTGGDFERAEPIISDVCMRYDEMNETEIQKVLQRPDGDVDLDLHGWTCLRVKNLTLWGNTLLHMNRFQTGVEVLERAVKDAERIMGSDDVITASAKNSLGLGYGSLGRLGDAVNVMDPATRFLETRLTEGDGNVCSALKVLGAYYTKLGQHAEAQDAAERLLCVVRRLNGGESNAPDDVSARLLVARTALRARDFSTALEIVGPLERGPPTPSAGREATELVTLCMAMMKCQEAADAMDENGSSRRGDEYDDGDD